MVAFNKYNAFIDEVSKGTHDLQNDTLKAALSNTGPTGGNGLTDTTWSAGLYPPPSAANNYTTGGNTLTRSSATTSTYVFKLVLADSTFTATAGGIGPFRYVYLYNSTQTNKLIGWYDYGSSITLADIETFTVDFDPTNGVIQINMTP